MVEVRKPLPFCTNLTFFKKSYQTTGLKTGVLLVQSLGQAYFALRNGQVLIASGGEFGRGQERPSYFLLCRGRH